MSNPFVALYERNELFWLGLAFFAIGALLPAPLRVWRFDVAQLFVVTGGGLLVASVPVGFYKLLTPS